MNIATTPDKKADFVTVDGRRIPIEGERNLLELIRKAGIDLPTFCYHSDLSVYGACRLCIVDIEGRGICGSCSTPPEPGMRINTHSEEVRGIRKVAIELLLANHDMQCATCHKSHACQLRELARRMGVDEVRFKRTTEFKPRDESSPSIVRDPNKCVLCGDCVRACHEIMGVGAIDFSGRGANCVVAPAFNRDLNEVECVGCGQCSAVCPTGALTPAREVEDVWAVLDDPTKTVVAQVAPAVRAGLGEVFGMDPGKTTTAKTVAALKAMGFDQVYDTCFAADLTVIEEAEEFIRRKTAGENLPLFTSCCPAWVKFVELNYPELDKNLSTCRSPQQMFGSVARKMLPEALRVDPDNLVIVSVMPCTAKKAEAKLEKFRTDGRPDVDYVITTQGVGRMIEEAGLNFPGLPPESFDMPLGFRTGAGVIFGASGGVSEAVLRYAVEKLGGETLKEYDFPETRGTDGIRELTVEVGGITVRMAIVCGLANARKVCDQILAGKCEYDLIEVMTCPGGCVAGAGQPPSKDPLRRALRAKALYDNDKQVQVHKPQDNFEVARCYREFLGEPGSHAAHTMLHTHYENRKKMAGVGLEVPVGDTALDVAVCAGAACKDGESREFVENLVTHLRGRGFSGGLTIRSNFSFERSSPGISFRAGGVLIENCTIERALAEIDRQLDEMAAAAQ